MESVLLVVIAVLLLLAAFLWARTRTIARSQFEDWRRHEINRLEAEAAHIAGQQARLDLDRWLAESEASIRRDAIARSGSVVLGKATEHLAPVLGSFPYNPRDVRFIGSPIDLVVFDGLDAGAVERVVFIEIKSGAGQLSGRQRQVRDVVKRGAVSWEEWRLPEPP